MQPVAVKEALREEIGVYRLAEEIGRGNVAVVYRATDTLYDREVALKVLHPYFAHYLSFVRHFIAEGREGMRLQHPNIVRVFDAGMSDGVAYIAQELVSGGTLADMVQARGGPFTLDETIAVIEQAAAGLDHAHHLGCLHRNLKPSNLFFADQGRIQIADFSAATPPGGSPPANYPVGTPGFMSPEQARGDAGLDQRADIYSLGVIAFLMLSGRQPFEAENPLVLLRKIIEETPPLLERVQPTIEPSVAQAVSQVLAKRPSARYLTAAAFAQALAHGQPAASRFSAPAAQEERPVPAALALPALSVPAAPAKATPVTLTFSRRSVMLAGMLLVTLLLVLAILAASVAPGIFRRIAGRETPAAVAVLPTQVNPPPPASPSAAQPTTAASVPALALAATPTSTLTTVPAAAVSTAAAALVTPPPTVKMLPTATAPLTATPTPSPSATPTETPVATATPTDENAADGANAGDPAVVALVSSQAAPADGPSPAGRIAYTVRNIRTDELDTVIYNLATGVKGPVLAAKRQPDFNNQSDLALNSEGGGMDGLVLMRPTGELITIASAFAEDSHPHWSPNNRALVFDSSLVGDGRYRLYLQQDTNYGQKVGPLMYDVWELFGRYPIFMLDGRIAYNGCNVWENASSCGIFVIEQNGSEPQNVTNWPGDIPTDNLGNQILAMSDRGGDWNVYLVSPVSGALRALTDDHANDGLATASPDGNFIAFVSDRDGQWGVYVMRSDGSAQRKLFDLEAGYGLEDRDWRQERLSWGR